MIMTTTKRLFFLSVMLLVITAGVAAAGAGGIEKVDELIGRLGQGNWQNAVDALVQIGEPAVEPLIRTLQDRSIKTWNVHARAANALAKIGSQRAVETVLESLEDAGLNPYARGSIAMILAELKPNEAAEALSRASRDKNQFVRWKCTQALGILGNQQGTNALIARLSDEDQNVRAAAARSLGQIKAENAAGNLIGALKDESWLIRLNARQALLQMDEPAVEQLITALKDKNSLIRWQSAWALGRIESEKAIEPLIETLADDDWIVSDQAAVALTKINSQKVIELLAEALKNMTDQAREQAVWITNKIKLNKAVKEEPKPHKTLEKKPPDKIYCGQKVYPCYPATLDAKPDIPSPHTTLKGEEVITAFTKDGKYALIPVTVENGKPLNYKQNQWGKGLQLETDTADFPALARTGLHSEAELNRTKIITSRSIVEIIELGRPGRSSGAGFMSNDEDIISVLKGDNHLVEQLGLKHPQMARPLYHIWNMILIDVELNRLGRFWEHFEYILYNGQKVRVKAEGTKGWQESIFDDEIQGKFEIQVQREPNPYEKAFLLEKYTKLTKDQMDALLHKLSHLHISEMAPYYIMRYGFYEGHTDYRTDPIAIVLIFGIRNLEQIETMFPGRLPEVMTQHFIRQGFVSP